MNIAGFIFRCTAQTFQECFERNLFGEVEDYLPIITQLNEDSILFLYNTTNWRLYGPFKAVSKGSRYLNSGAWNGRYPAQIKFKQVDHIKSLSIDLVRRMIKFKGVYPYPILNQSQVKELSMMLDKSGTKINIPVL